MKNLIINVMVGIGFWSACVWILFQINQLNAISDKLVVDNRQEIAYDEKVEISNYKIMTNKEVYYEIKKEAEAIQLAEEKRLIKERKEYVASLAVKREAKEKERQREIEEYRKLREKEKAVQVVSRSNTETNTQASDWMVFEASYYTSECYKCSGVTASGVDVRNTIHYNNYRIIAADTKIIPLWSLVEVVTPHETFKALVLDTGGKIKSHKIDVLVANKKTAYDLGRHDVKLRVIKYGGKN